MTDNEIIKALECCTSQEGNCDICPQHSRTCVYDLLRLSLDCINRQKAEIERLNNTIYTFEKHFEFVKAEAVRKFAERLCEDRVSNDPVVIAVKVELKAAGVDNG